MRVVLALLIFAVFSWAEDAFNGSVEIFSIDSNYAGELKINDKTTAWLDHPT